MNFQPKALMSMNLADIGCFSLAIAKHTFICGAVTD